MNESREIKGIKLQKYISDCGLMSRRAAEEKIKLGAFTVNGKTALLGDRIEPEKDTVLYGGERVKKQKGKICIMLNKPKGYITTASDELGRKNVCDLVKPVGRRLYPVGRLDKDSEGLILMTDDGELTNRLTHPSFGCTKTYILTVSGKVSNEALDRMRALRELDGGEKIVGCKVELISRSAEKSDIKVILSEGKNRQIRRTAAIVGLEVKNLKRIAVGSLYLGELESGAYRALTESELKRLCGNLSKDKKSGEKKK